MVAIEALQAEVNNGGFYQFFLNSSKAFAPIIVDALTRIECPQMAEITQRAIHALHLPALSVQAIDAAMDELENEEELDRCAPEDVDEQLFAFIKGNRKSISL